MNDAQTSVCTSLHVCFDRFTMTQHDTMLETVGILMGILVWGFSEERGTVRRGGHG